MPRARPLPPEERRAAIVAAARPLFVAHAEQFTTRQVAEAAGIAEGTIFRVFPTKDDLVTAVLEDALDPSATCRALVERTVGLDLEHTLEQVLTVLAEATRESSAVFSAFHHRAMGAAHGAAPEARHRTPPAPERPGHRDAAQRADQLLAAVTTALQPHADDLAVPVEQAASFVRTVAVAATHPYISGPGSLDPAQLAGLLLHGIADRSPDTIMAPPSDADVTPSTPHA